MSDAVEGCLDHINCCPACCAQMDELEDENETLKQRVTELENSIQDAARMFKESLRLNGNFVSQWLLDKTLSHVEPSKTDE